jgi:hypothetical protein
MYHRFNVGMTLFVAALFAVLTPGVLLSLPPGGSKLVKAGVHGLVFALVLHYTYHYVARMTEGFEDKMAATGGAHKKKEGFTNAAKKQNHY